MSGSSTEERLASIEARQNDIHKFLFESPTIGGPTRAEQIDSLLTIARSSKFTARFFLWIFGATVTGLGVWQSVKSLFPKIGG